MELIHGNCREVLPSVLSRYKNPIIVSDPPFNIGYHYNQYKDKMGDKEYMDMLYEIFGNHSSVVVHYPEYLYALAIRMKRVPTRVVSWVYNSNTAKQHRDVAFWLEGGGKARLQ